MQNDSFTKANPMPAAQAYRAKWWAALLLVAITVITMTHATAGEADVLKATAHGSTPGKFRFDVTIRSQDAGWDYYCDRFEIVSLDGKVLGTRILFHPHVDEQPFTRSVSGVNIPAGTKKVLIRASMKPGGKGGKTITLILPKS